MRRATADYWAPRINAEWRKSVEGILNVGRELIAAKESCEHGEFLRLFKGHDDAVSLVFLRAVCLSVSTQTG